MGASAELHRITVEGSALAADLDDADFVPVFVAEELHHVGVVLHLGMGNLEDSDLVVREDASVHFRLDPVELVGVDRRGVEVKSEPVRSDERSLLGRVGIDELMKRPVEKVGRGVVLLDASTTGLVDFEDHVCGGIVRELRELEHGRLANPEHGDDGDTLASRDEDAGVTLLAAFFDVKRAAIHDREDARAVVDPVHDLGFGLVFFISDELGLHVRLDRDGFDHGGRAAFRSGALVGIDETGDFVLIGRERAFVEEQLGQVGGKAESLPEFHDGVGGEFGPVGDLGSGVVEQLQSAVEGAVELLFLGLENSGDFLLPGRELGEDIAEFRDEYGDELVEERIRRVESEDTAEAHGASQDVANDVVATTVAGLDPVGNGKADGADVVADDAEGDVDLLLLGEAVAFSALGHRRGIGLAGEGRKLRENRGEDVGVVVRGETREIGESFRALDRGAGALEAHPGIDVAGGEGAESAVLVRIELDEDEVPDLDAAGVAAVDEAAFGVAFGGKVDMNLRTGTAGTGLAHHPEVVLAVAVDDMDGRIKTRLFKDHRPEVVGFLIKFRRVALGRSIDRCVKPVRSETPALREQLPGPVDRLGLEVVAEAPVPQHLEESVVVGVVADILEVVVLAPGADALLRVGGARRIVGRGLGAEEIGNKLVHPRVGEQQVGGCRHEGGRGHNGVLFFFEKIEEGLPDFA